MFLKLIQIYSSILIQCVFIIIGFWIVDGSGLGQLSFASSILETANLIVLVRDNEGKIIYNNNFAAKTFALSNEELLNKGWDKLIPSSSISESTSHVKKALSTKKTANSYITKSIPAGESKIDID